MKSQKEKTMIHFGAESAIVWEVRGVQHRSEPNGIGLRSQCQPCI